ncbi:MAG: RES family NAD+ phosphorylase [Gammaproteobacteria bacterium]
MSSELWTSLKGYQHLTKLQLDAWRLVEDQYESATRKLVDTLEEHEILEDLLETSKPNQNTLSSNYNYLLSTPFLYPPLKHGSRFGNKLEPSLWYGSYILTTAMAEVAFYRFVFFDGWQTNVKLLNEILLTSFKVHVKTTNGIDLTKPPFIEHKHIISSPTTYFTSQLLGSKMRADNIKAFLYYSARDLDKGVNVGIFSPEIFLTKKPKENSLSTWHCITSEESVEFVEKGIEKKKFLFEKNQFLINGVLPFPA